MFLGGRVLLESHPAGLFKYDSIFGSSKEVWDAAKKNFDEFEARSFSNNYTLSQNIYAAHFW